MSQKWSIVFWLLALVVICFVGFSSFCRADDCAICSAISTDCLCLVNMYGGSLTELRVSPPFSGLNDINFDCDNSAVVYETDGLRVVSLPGQGQVEAVVADEHYTRLPDYGELRQNFCHQCSDRIVKAVELSPSSCRRLALPDFTIGPVKLTYCEFALIVDLSDDLRPVYVLTPGDAVAIRRYTVLATGDISSMSIKVSGEPNCQGYIARYNNVKYGNA